MEVLRVRDAVLMLRAPKRFFEDEVEQDSGTRTLQFFIVARVAGFLTAMLGSFMVASLQGERWSLLIGATAVAKLYALMLSFVLVNGAVVHGNMYIDRTWGSYWRILEYPLEYEGTYRDTFAVFMYASIVVALFAPVAGVVGIYGIVIAPFSLLVSAYVSYIVLAGLSEFHDIKWIAELKQRWPGALLIDADIITLVLVTLFLVFVEVSVTPLVFGLDVAAAVAGFAVIFILLFAFIEAGIELF